MILHLFDDEKISNRIVANFNEVFPNGNRYVCFYKNKLRYIKKNQDIIYIDYGKDKCDKNILDGVNIILIHYLSVRKIHFINDNIPENLGIKIYWAFWGADLYNDVLFSKGYEIYFEKNIISVLKSKVKNIIKYIVDPKDTLKYSVRLKLHFISSRIDYILTSDAEYKILEKYLGDVINVECINKGAIYYPIEDVMGSLFGKYVEGNNIMIGNSASLTNNHVYAMSFLSKLNTNGRNKNVPLSYGGSPRYICHAVKRGLKFWGNEFKPLTDFMPLDDYNKLMLSNNVFIYGNWRQEAVGNIVIAIYIGAKVFVSERSPLIEYFQSEGVKLYATEKMTQEDIDTPESIEVIENNRKAILKMYSKESIYNNIKSIFS